MNNEQFFIYLMIVVVSTYLIRVIPFSLIKKKITNKYINSFLYYIPYTVLAAMTFPAALYATGSIFSAIGGLVVALFLAIKEKSLIIVAIAASLTALVIELFMMI